jgi:hypothetical protein
VARGLNARHKSKIEDQVPHVLPHRTGRIYFGVLVSVFLVIHLLVSSRVHSRGVHGSLSRVRLQRTIMIFSIISGFRGFGSSWFGFLWSTFPWSAWISTMCPPKSSGSVFLWTLELQNSYSCFFLIWKSLKFFAVEFQFFHHVSIWCWHMALSLGTFGRVIHVFSSDTCHPPFRDTSTQ